MLIGKIGDIDIDDAVYHKKNKKKTNNPDKVIKDLRKKVDELTDKERYFEWSFINEQNKNNKLQDEIDRLNKELAHRDRIIADLRKLKDR